MEVIDNRNKAVEFGELEAGIIIDYEGLPFIKVYFDGNSYIVSLANGRVFDINSKDTVKVLDCTLTINK